MTDEIDPVEVNERYQRKRSELQELRRTVHATAFDEVARFPVEDLVRTLRTYHDRVTGDLLAFVANDFGMPVAFRPNRLDKPVQDRVRVEILERKYQQDEKLNAIREAIVEDVRIHKALVAAIDGDEIRYHLPGVTNGATNFITVREGVGLVDFCTNGNQKNCLVY